MAPGEEIALEPAQQRVLGKYFHHPPVARQLAAIGILGQELGHPDLLARLEDRLQPVRRRLVGTVDAEGAGVRPHRVAQELAQRSRILVQYPARLPDLHRVAAEVGELEVATQQPAVCMRIGAHPALTRWRQGPEFGHESALRVEQRLWLVAPQPVLEELQPGRIAADVGEGHLVRAPRSLDLVAADLLRPAPAFRRPEHNHRPARPLSRAPLHARLPLDRADVGDHRVERRRHLRVHFGGIIALDEVRRVAVAAEQGVELVVADPGKHRRVGDLVAVEVQDRQHRTVPGRVDELVRMPCGGERAGLSLAIADDAGDDEVGVVERRAIGVRQAIAELAALVDRARRLRGDVRADVAGEGELLEEPPEPFEVLALVGIGLGVGALEIGRPEDARGAVAGPGHEDHVEIVTTDHTVEVRPDKGERRAGAPVAEQPPLHVLGLQRLPQQRVVGEIDHPDRQVVAGTPPPIEERQLVLGRSRAH